MQDCCFIPIWCTENKEWVYENKFQFNHVESGAQIHHNGKNHWFTSVKLLGTNEIFILDSAGFTKLNSCSQIQLAKLYTKPRTTYDIIFPNYSLKTVVIVGCMPLLI